MTNGYYITYNGINYTDRGLAKLIHRECKSNLSDSSLKSIMVAVQRQIDWVLANCGNVNDKALGNALDQVWFNHVKLYTKMVQDVIDATIQTNVDNGRVRHSE